MTIRTLAGVLAALAFVGVTSPAAAQSAHRAWVSGHGTDTAGCGAPTAPCRSLQYAHDNIVASGGEIDILDPAGYGAVTITKAISIINDGAGTAGLQATTGAVVEIDAGGVDSVRLRGLDIEGLGSAIAGVAFNSGGSLVIEDSAINHVISGGVQFTPSAPSRLVVENTKVTNCPGVGVRVAPTISGSQVVVATLHRFEGIANGEAIFVSGVQSPAPNAQVDLTVADSVVTGGASGVHAISGSGHAAVVAMVRNSTFTDNSVAIAADISSQLFLGHSTLSANTTAFLVGSGATLASYGDNNVDGNASLGATPTTVSFH